MVKERSDKYVDRYMAEYKMRTPYATPTQINRFSPDHHTERSSHRHAAHEKSHLRHDLPNPFYHSEGRIEKNTRTKKPAPQPTQYQTNNYQHTTVPTPQKSSCCTIL